MNGIQNITPKDLQARLESGEDILVIDVREDWEVEITSIEVAQQIVLHTIPERAEQDIPKDKPIVFICRSGGRSLQAAFFLSQNGWDAGKLYNLDGGILRWAQEVDPTLPTYY